MNFAEELKKARGFRGLTQKKIAEVLKIPLQTIKSWESGRRVPPEYVQKNVIQAIQMLR